MELTCRYLDPGIPVGILETMEGAIVWTLLAVDPRTNLAFLAGTLSSRIQLMRTQNHPAIRFKLDAREYHARSALAAAILEQTPQTSAVT